MSDIPVGSPPVPPGRHAAPSGWYADPVDPTRERYWDGWQWSRNVRDREGPPAPYAPPHAGPGYAPAPPAGPPPAGVTPPAYPPYPTNPPNYAPAPGPPQGYGYGSPAALTRRMTADGVRLSGWWWRVLASWIDGAIIGIVVGIIGAPILRELSDAFMVYIGQVLDAQQTGVVPPNFDLLTVLGFRNLAILTLLQAGVGMAYHVGFLRWRGATLGKMACGLRVVPVDQGRFAGKLSWNCAGIRAAVWVMPGVAALTPAVGFAFSVFNLLDALFPLFSPKRQSIHDLAAKTQVIRTR